jgi:energy-coupling factor transporter transmembrane protein EcfT
MLASSVLPQFHVIGFTGHRILGDPALVKSRIEEALNSLRKDGAGEWLAVSSAAIGGDTLFAHEVLGLGMEWEALLPLPVLDFRNDFSPEDWAKVEELTAKASAVRIVAQEGNREEAYLDCGIETVNACDVLIAVWDGEPARGAGGTADIVTFARELKRPLIVIDPVKGDVRRENFQHFNDRDPELAFLNALPEINAPEEPIDGLDLVDRFMDKTDRAASSGAPKFRMLTASAVLLHVAATVVATAGLAFHWHPVGLPWAKLLFVLGALFSALAIRHLRAQDTWVRCRLAAELARAMKATWGMTRKTALFEDIDLPDTKHLVRSFHILHMRDTRGERPNLDTFRHHYRINRVEDQLAYYRRRLAKAEPQLRRLRLGFSLSTVMAIVATATYAIQHTFHVAEIPWVVEAVGFYFLPIVLPVVAAAFMSFVSINDLHRRVARYREMCHLLESAQKQIMVTHSWRSLEQLVRRTERALLSEVLEWHTLMSHLETHH